VAVRTLAAGTSLNTRHASGAGGQPPALWLWFPTYHIVTFTVIVCIGLLRLLYSPTLTRREDRVTEIRSDWFGRGEISRAGHNETLSDLGR
jgi:hypothetical protein